MQEGLQCIFLQERSKKILDASKELEDKKLTANEFLNRITYPQHKLLPKSILDYSVVSGGGEDDTSSSDDADVPPTPPSQDNPFTCKICFAAVVDIFFEPCTHMAVCETCWATMRAGFKEQSGIEIDEIDAALADDPTLVLPDEMFPLCPTCRQAVKRFRKVIHWNIFFCYYLFLLLSLQKTYGYVP